MVEYLSPEEREFERGWTAPQGARQMLIATGAFKGYSPEEYSALLDLIAAFMVSSRCKDLKSYKELIEGLIKLTHGAKLETISTRIEPTITTKFLADQIGPWVEDIRETLFSTKSAPFACIEDAEKWLDDGKKRSDAWVKRAKEYWHKQLEYRDYQDLLCEKYHLLSGRFDAWAEPPIEHPTEEEVQLLDEVEKRRLSYLKPGKLPEDKQAGTYIKLSADSRKISEATGFTIESVEMYILADILPVLPPITLGIVEETHTLPSGIGLLNRYAKVTIRGNTTGRDLRSLYPRIRRKLGIKRLKRLSEINMRLHEMVRQRGGIPSEEDMVKPFWESIWREWNTLPPKDRPKSWRKYKSPQIVRITYGRIIDRLERMMIQRGGTK